MDELTIPELDVPIIFRERPAALPGDLRPLWRVSLLVLLLRKCCRGDKSSLRRIHVLSSAARSKEVAETLLDAIENVIPPGLVIVRIEPALNRAIDYAIGEGLVKRGKKDRLELTSAGKKFADELMQNPLLLASEKRFINAVGYRVNEAFVQSMFKREWS